MKPYNEGLEYSAPHKASRMVIAGTVSEQIYTWQHLPTGIIDQRSLYNLTRNEALELLNSYNRQGKGIWQYWMV